MRCALEALLFLGAIVLLASSSLGQQDTPPFNVRIGVLVYNAASTGECSTGDGNSGLQGAEYFARVMSQKGAGALPITTKMGFLEVAYTVVGRVVTNCSGAAQVEALDHLIHKDNAHFVLSTQLEHGAEVSQAANDMQRLLYHCCLVDDSVFEEVSSL